MTTLTNVEFLEAMFADLPDGACATFCSFAGDPLTVRPRAWRAQPWDYGAHLGTGPVTNNYVAVSSFWPDPVLGEYRRRKTNFARLHAVMLDDLGDGPGAKLPMHHADRLPVSALIETSPSNFQAWIFLAPDVDTDTRTKAERLIDAMIKQGLSSVVDPGMSGVTRYGRLPAGVNGKAKYRQGGRPFHVRLARWSPETRYPVADVVQVFGLDLAPEPVPVHVPVTLDTAHARIDEFGQLVEALSAHGLYQASIAGGRHLITCPWISEHTDRADSGTALLEPSSENRWAGGFCCFHGHCADRGIGDVYKFVRGLARGAA